MVKVMLGNLAALSQFSPAMCSSRIATPLTRVVTGMEKEPEVLEGSLRSVEMVPLMVVEVPEMDSRAASEV